MSLVVTLQPSDDEEPESPRTPAEPRRKKRRIDDDEYEPEPAESEEEEAGESGVDELDDSVECAMEEDEDDSGPESRPKSGGARKRKTPAGAKTTPARGKLAAWKNTDDAELPESGAGVGDSAGADRKFAHLAYEFLYPDRIRDKMRRRPDEAEYDRRTLHVPESFLAQQTPAMRQWWAMKAEHFDSILFFKLGKFYEVYHMDAVIAVEQLSLIFMKVCFFLESGKSIFLGGLKYSSACLKIGIFVALFFK